VDGGVRALIVGAGGAGQRHAEALDELGIPYGGPLSARAVASDLSPLRDSRIQVVHVCSENSLHGPLVTAALDAGKDVVCEKPLTLDVRTAVEMAAFAERSGRLAVVAYNTRFHPMVVELSARVSAGTLGPLHGVRGGYLQDWLMLKTDDDWRVDAARGGASRVVADIGTHWADLAERITERSVEAVVAQVGRLHDRATEDHAEILLRFAGGLAGACVLSQASAGHRNEFELSLDGAAGSATWRSQRPAELWLGRRGDTRVITREGGELISPEAARLAALPSGPNESRRNFLAAVYARVGGSEETAALRLPTFVEGLRHVRFAAAALASAQQGKWVDVA
jgi:predicted dehydrogenase